VLEKIDKLLPWMVALKQSILLTFYIFLVGLIMSNGNKLFGPMDRVPILAPLLMLSLFIFSAIISATLVLGYPFYIFWVKKNLDRAAKIIGFTVLWLFIFILIYLFTLIYLK